MNPIRTYRQLDLTRKLTLAFVLVAIVSSITLPVVLWALHSIDQVAGSSATVAPTTVADLQQQVHDRVAGFTKAVLFGFAASLVLAALIGFLLARSTVGRVLRIRDGVAKLAAGEVGARIDESPHNDELRVLEQGVNQLGRSLALREKENVALQEQLHAKLQNEHERATRDPLTGLHNRRHFEELLTTEIHRTDRTGEPTSVAIIDLDNFKQVNDRFGHAEGDAVLQRMAQSLIACLRPYDTACRIGGEEFGIVFPATPPEGAMHAMQRLAETCRPYGPNGDKLTFSGGIAAYPLHAATNDDLFQLADESVYASKGAGKDRTTLYDPKVVAKLDSRQREQERTRELGRVTARTLVAAIEAKEPYSRSHSEMVAAYAEAIAQKMGLHAETVQMIHEAGLLHDVGKISVPDSILTKAGRLDDDEFAVVRQHPELGYHITLNAQVDHTICEWVRYHHEHVDGSGYPFGLSGEQIPLPSRIIHVAEAFDAMTSDRAYRRAISVYDAYQVLADAAGAQFDAMVVATLFRLHEEGAIDAIRARQAPGDQPPLAA